MTHHVVLKVVLNAKQMGALYLCPLDVDIDIDLDLDLDLDLVVDPDVDLDTDEI